MNQNTFQEAVRQLLLETEDKEDALNYAGEVAAELDCSKEEVRKEIERQAG